MCRCVEEFEAWGRAQGWAPHTVVQRVQTVARTSAATGMHPCALSTTDMIVALDRPLSAWSRVTYVRDLRAWGRWLVASGRRDDDPALGLAKPRTPRGVPRPVSEPDLARLLTRTSGKVHAMLILAAYEGLRVHEVAKFRGEDITAEGLFVEGKGGVTAFVPVHPRVELVARSMPAFGYWFPSAVGHVTAMHAGRMMARAMVAAGVPGTPHQLRHRFGTAVLRSSGGNLRVAQQLLRHASPATTAIYTLVSSDEAQAAVHLLT